MTTAGFNLRFRKAMARNLLLALVCGLVAATAGACSDTLPVAWFGIDTPLFLFVGTVAMVLNVIPLPSPSLRGLAQLEGGRFAVSRCSS